MALAVNDPVLLSIKALAARDGVSTAAVSKRVKQMVERHGLEVRRNPNGSVAAVNVVHHDMLRQQFGDNAQVRRSISTPANLPVADDVAPTRPSVESLDRARMDKTKLEAERLRLELAARRGELVRRDAMVDAVTRLGADIGRCLDMTQHADALAAAAAKGLHALRAELKRITFAMQTQVADHCAGVALVAPAQDEPIAIEAEAA